MSMDSWEPKRHYLKSYNVVLSVCTPVSSNITDRHDITEILLKVALNTIKPNQTSFIWTDNTKEKGQIMICKTLQGRIYFGGPRKSDIVIINAHDP
jgi:hypothetical protein